MVTLLLSAILFQPPIDINSLDPYLRLQNADVKVRLQAANELANSKVELRPKEIAALAKVIDDPDPRIRKVAIQTLGEVGPRSREWGGGPKLSARLAKLFDDKDTLTKRAAVWAYGQIGIDAESELEPLYAVFKNPSPDLRGLAVAAAAQYVHEQTTAEMRVSVLNRIADSLADKDARVQRLAAEVLVKGAGDSVPGLKRMLDTTTGPGRLWAALTLGEIGPAARDAIPSLQKAFPEVPNDGKLIVQTALKKIGQ